MVAKKQLREMAKDRLVEALSTAYYAFTDGFTCPEFDALSETEQEEVLRLIDKYGKAMCKAINKKYYTV